METCIERTTQVGARLANGSHRDLAGVDYVYWWVDGIHFNVRLEDDRLCCPVIVGVRHDGTKELIAVADGYREDTESSADLLRGHRDPGLADPTVAVGGGALGFWAALQDVIPATVEQRCRVHETPTCWPRCPSDSTAKPSSGPQTIEPDARLA